MTTTNDRYRATSLREQLALVKKLHEQTGKAIAALEMELNRVQQDYSYSFIADSN